MGLFETTEEELIQQAMCRPLDEKISKALLLIQTYEAKALQLSPDGYYVCFSGGKDSIVMERLFKMAGVKYQIHYSNVTIDPPELVWFLKKNYPETVWHSVGKPLPLMMVDSCHGPPTRVRRWCCEIYKEGGGAGRFISVGVRAEESARRKGLWRSIAQHKTHKTPIMCPLLYWTEHDIWRFIRQRNISYCELYDQGFKRLGCVGCPLGGPRQQRMEFDRWPRYEALWKLGFQAYWERWKGVPRRDGKPRWIEKFDSWQQVWDWWILGKAYEGNKPDCQLWLW